MDPGAEAPGFFYAPAPDRYHYDKTLLVLCVPASLKNVVLEFQFQKYSVNRILFIVFLLFSSLGSLSQEVTITDMLTGRPLEGVVITSAGAVTQSDSRGKASLSHFPEEGKLLFTHPSYLSLRVEKQRLPGMKFHVRMEESPLAVEEVVVSVSRSVQGRTLVPHKAESLPASLLEKVHPPTTADLAGLSGEVYIQKSQQGGGSPMMRGFSANRLLLVFDGVRMNNAIYRSGNLQNIVSVDANMLENTEIVPGPGSVAYGSDALGGVFAFYTHKPRLSTSGDWISQGTYRMRAFSADRGTSLHLRWGAGNRQWGILLGGTWSRFGDLKMGSHGPEDYLRREYVVPTLFTGRDSVVANGDPRIQRPTAYHQANLMAKVRWKPSSRLEVNLGGHYSGTSDVPRYDRLILTRRNRLRYGDWYYGPQEWTLVNADIDYTGNTALFDRVHIIPAFQRYSESRHDRNIDDPLLSHRKEKLTIFTLTADFHKALSRYLRVSYGLEGAYNEVVSRGWTTQLLTGEQQAAAPRYPARSGYGNMAAYLSSHLDLSPAISLEGGIRATLTHAEGEFTAGFNEFPEPRFRQTNSALNGSLGVVWHPSAGWHFRVLASTGFRAPNIDDMAKTFDSAPGNVVVPNPALKPEYARNLEAGILWRAGEIARIEATVFVTSLTGAMVRRPFLLRGQDSILYSGVMSRVEALVNVESARIAGTSWKAEVRLSPTLRSHHTLTLITGKDAEGFPVRHVPPLYGQSDLRYGKNQWFATLTCRYNGKIPYSRLAPDERDKPWLYLSDTSGNPHSPAWMTLDLHAAREIHPALKISAGIENLTNRRYRPYSSGIVAPGTSLVLSLCGKF